MDRRSGMALPQPELECHGIVVVKPIELLPHEHHERGVGARIDDENGTQDGTSGLGARAWPARQYRDEPKGPDRIPADAANRVAASSC